MGQSILCPQCDKRFRLSDTPPAQATCSGCGTLMDLTAFGGGAPAAPEPAAPAEPSTPKSRPHRASRAGARRHHRPTRGGAPRGRQEAPPAQPPMSGGTQAILIFVGVLILVLAIVVSGKRDADDAGPAKIPSATIARDDAPSRLGAPYSAEPTADTPLNATAPRADGAKGKDASGKRRIPVSRRTNKPRLSRIELTTHDWPEEVDPGTRAQVEEAIRKMYVGGRDGVEATDWLVKQGRPIAGRIISEFKAIEASPGFDDREGASLAMMIDGVLRRMDGQIERFWEERERIRAWGVFAAPSFIERIAKRWTWWWTEGEWKTNPREPWDAFEDESDTTKDGRKAETPAKDDEKKGYGKRAGSGN